MTEEADGTTARLEMLAAGLVARYRWQEVRAATIVARVQSWQEDPAASALPDLPVLCLQAAGEWLYTACSAPPPDDNRGYDDLRRYLEVTSGQLAPPAPPLAWDDLIQETLLVVRARLTDCRNPRAFLPWALEILRTAGKRSWRRRRAHSLDAAIEQAGEAAHPPSPERSVDPTGDQELLRILRECLDTDEERGWALWLVLGLKRREWALIFESSLTHYDWLRQRVRRKLMRCSALLLLMDRAPSAA
jgi:DNA-directed RNA polymerase specialized sigma24 family protein